MFQVRLKITQVIILLEQNKEEGADMLDGLYKKMRCVLKKKIIGIHLVSNLRDTKKPRIRLNGMLIRENNKENRAIIFLDSGDHKTIKAKTLIHELVHYIFPTAKEQSVLKLEELIWKRISRKKKEKFKKLIPIFVSNESPKNYF